MMYPMWLNERPLSMDTPAHPFPLPLFELQNHGDKTKVNRAMKRKKVLLKEL